MREKREDFIMKAMSGHPCRSVTRLLVSSLFCFALGPLFGAEEAAGQAVAPVPALTAAEQAAADALIAKHGKNALAYCRMWADKDYTESQACNTVEYLVSKGADVNAKTKDENGYPPLYLAAFYGNTGVVKFLLSKGADVHATESRGETPLHAAGNIEVAKLLVAQGADVNAKSKYGEAPIHTTSARAHNAEIIAFLVDKGADVRARSGRGQEPIHEVVQFGNVQAVKTLVSLGADILAKEDDSGHSALHIAATQNPDVDVVRFLVSQGADVNAKDRYGNPVLHLAAACNSNVEVMKCLVSQGADIRTKDGSGETLLHAAAHQRDHKAEGREGRNADHARYVVSLGLDIHAKDNKGQTPLHQAGSAEVARYLVSLGADIRAKDNDGQTPLHTVWSPEVVQYLVSKGADIHAKDNQGRTPLDVAATSGKSVKISEFLMSKGVSMDVNATIPGWHGWGTTRLHEAVERNSDWNIEAVKLLVSQGADVNAHSVINGNTPLHDAVRRGWKNDGTDAGNIEIITYPVSYTHLTLPTKRIV